MKFEMIQNSKKVTKKTNYFCHAGISQIYNSARRSKQDENDTN